MVHIKRCHSLWIQLKTTLFFLFVDLAGCHQFNWKKTNGMKGKIETQQKNTRTRSKQSRRLLRKCHDFELPSERYTFYSHCPLFANIV